MHRPKLERCPHTFAPLCLPVVFALFHGLCVCGLLFSSTCARSGFSFCPSPSPEKKEKVGKESKRHSCRTVDSS